MAYLVVVDDGRRRDQQGGGRARGEGANLDVCLDFSPDSVAQTWFPLPLEPLSAPSVLDLA